MSVDVSSISIRRKPPRPLCLWVQMELCSSNLLQEARRIRAKHSKDDAILHLSHLFHQVVDGVCALHKRRLAHRDLKPSNIFVTDDSGAPIVKIGDFGLSKHQSEPLPPDPHPAHPVITTRTRLVDGVANLNLLDVPRVGCPPRLGAGSTGSAGSAGSTGSAGSAGPGLLASSFGASIVLSPSQHSNFSTGVGTLLYMAPEARRGGGLDYQKCDLYSLGIIFCELLCEFGTSMERIHVLTALRESDGVVVPEGLPEPHASYIRQLLSRRPEVMWANFKSHCCFFENLEVLVVAGFAAFG